MSPTTASPAANDVSAACAKMVEAERTRNLDAASALIWDDAVWLAPNTPPVIGLKDIRALFADFFQLPFVEMTADVTGIRVSDSGDLASVWGTFALKFDGGATDSANFLMSWERRDGAWKASANMFCSNVPLPESA